MPGLLRLARLLAVATLGLLLAGCADDAASPDEALPPVIVVVALSDEPFDGYAYIGSAASGCLPVGLVCLGGGAFPQPIVETPDDADSLAIHVELAATQFVDGPVDWQMTCSTSEDYEEPAPGADPCRSHLGNGSGTLPLTIDVANLRLPPETTVWLMLTVPPVAPGADLLLELLRGSTEYSGHVTVERVVDAP